jgi:hypothetical protein
VSFPSFFAEFIKAGFGCCFLWSFFNQGDLPKAELIRNLGKNKMGTTCCGFLFSLKV